MHFVANAVSIDIDLTNGLYRLPCTGGAGKTYLYKLLCSLMLSYKNIQCITYNEYDLKQMCDGIIMCDRFDLYQTEELIQRLTVLSESNVVLLDVKSLKYISECYPVDCILSRKEGVIHIYS